MYYNFWQKNKIFFAIILGAIIIGGLLYFGEQKSISNSRELEMGKTQAPVRAPSNASQISPQSKVVGFLPFGKNPTSSDVKISPQTAAQKKAEDGLPPTSAVACGAAQNTIVTKVIDGDTVVVEGGWHVRLLGMDADEKGYPCYDSARIRLEDLVLGKQVVLQKDISDVDQYGRCLRYIFLGSTNIDQQLVQEGLAVARFYSPDLEYRAQIAAAEQQAIAGKVGCKWSGAPQTATQ